MINTQTKNPIGKLGVWLLLVTIFLIACNAISDSSMQMEESPILRLLERKAGLIAYMGMDGNIYTIDQAGGNQNIISTDAQGLDPAFLLQFRKFAWSPDGQRLAYIGFTDSAVTLNTSGPDGSDQNEVFSSDNEMPFYLQWTPDGKQLSFLSVMGDSQNFHLRVSPVKGSAEPTTLGSGSPLFMSWEPDSRRVLTHHGGNVGEGPLTRLSIRNLDIIAEQDLGLTPAVFQAPAWSPDGNVLLMAVVDNGENALVLTNLQGRVRQTLATFDTAVAFNWSPDGEYISYIDSGRSRQGVLGKLTVIDPIDPDRKFVSEQNLVGAYFWSPDGKQIAFFTFELGQDAEGQDVALGIAIHILDVQSGESRQLSFDGEPLVFSPSSQFGQVLQFFDQYNQSATIWSPDSENIVVPMAVDRDQSIIVVLAVSGNLEPRPIVDGVLAFWSSR